MKKSKDTSCKEWISQIIEKIGDNVFAYSLDGICLYTNNHLLNTLWFNPVWMSLQEIFPHRSKKHIEEVISDYKKIRQTQKWDNIPEQKEKNAKWEIRVFSVTRDPIVWNWIPAISGIGKDITDLFLAKEEAKRAKKELQQLNEELRSINDELKSKNDQLEKSQKNLESFMNHIIHDLKNPAGAIIWFSDLILDTLNNILTKDNISEDTIDELKDFILSISCSSTRIMSFISDLTQYWKLNKPDLKIDQEIVNTKSFFDKLFNQEIWYLANINKQSKSQEYPEKNIDIIFDKNISNLPEFINTDPKLLQRVLNNLIDNAIKFTNKWSVTLKVEKLDKKLCFYVVDTGIGIDKNEHNVVFEEFKQSTTKCSSIVQWSGLGLSIVSKIVEKLWWSMLPIQSEVWKGSTFGFELPIN